MARMSACIGGLAIVLIVLGSVASPSAQNFGMVDGEKHFTIDWERGQYRGRPSVRGYIANSWGQAATDLRLKVEGLDAAGAVISTTIDRIPGDEVHYPDVDLFVSQGGGMCHKDGAPY